MMAVNLTSAAGVGSVLVYIVFAIAGFLAIRTLLKIDANQKLLTDKMLEHESRLSRLEGEHNARKMLYEVME